MNISLQYRDTFLCGTPCIPNGHMKTEASNERVDLTDSAVRTVLEKLPEKVGDRLKDVKVLFDKKYDEALITFFFAGYFITSTGKEDWEAEIEGKFCFNITPDLTQEVISQCLLRIIYFELTECSTSRPARPFSIQTELRKLAGEMYWT